MASATSAAYCGRRAAAEMSEGFVVASCGVKAAIFSKSPVSATTSVPAAGKEEEETRTSQSLRKNSL